MQQQHANGDVRAREASISMLRPAVQRKHPSIQIGHHKLSTPICNIAYTNNPIVINCLLYHYIACIYIKPKILAGPRCPANIVFLTLCFYFVIIVFCDLPGKQKHELTFFRRKPQHPPFYFVQ